MSRTLFWYVMRDLLRIFVMTSFTLAGIMSFGGLLRPLMRYGLSGAQVWQMLAYLAPAMMTYSLPISALFATTMVYGRLSADNELTACRACGISYMTLSVPAFVLGLVLALVSLLSLSFVVPAYTLKVEKVAFASLADMVQKSIQRTHQIKLQDITIYADSAEVLPPPPDGSNDERVVLAKPMFCVYETIKEKDGRSRYVPADFFAAASAQVRIHQASDHVECSASLVNGARFPRNVADAATGGIQESQFGPFPLPSPVRENTKFMDITQLKALDADPMRSREVRRLFSQLVRQQQESEYLSKVVVDALRKTGECRFDTPTGEVYRLTILDSTRRQAAAGSNRVLSMRGRSKLLINSSGATRDVHLARERNGATQTVDQARTVTLRAQADANERGVMRLAFELGDAIINTGEGGLTRESLSRPLRVAMPASILELENRNPQTLAEDRRFRDNDDQKELVRKLTRIQTGIRSELHGRASFAVSCLILVVVGCALGMMFKTGNFLNAFALSVIPALMSISLIVTGQNVSESGLDSLALGTALIWSGNVIVLVLAVALMGRLQKQ